MATGDWGGHGGLLLNIIHIFRRPAALGCFVRQLEICFLVSRHTATTEHTLPFYLFYFLSRASQSTPLRCSISSRLLPGATLSFPWLSCPSSFPDYRRCNTSCSSGPVLSSLSSHPSSAGHFRRLIVSLPAFLFPLLYIGWTATSSSHRITPACSQLLDCCTTLFANIYSLSLWLLLTCK